MRTVIHLSDLHFGRINPGILDPLLAFIRERKPDLVAISGDLTQRARTVEFLAAQKFLRAIPFPQIVVPGNHDVPLRNLFARFVRQLDSYRRYISSDLQPFFSDDELAVAGVNTARSLTWKDGRINRWQLAKLRATLAPIGPDRIKIVVTHHPFDLPAGAEGRVVGRSRLAIKTIAECGVDLLLAGHFHISDTGRTAKRYKIAGYSGLIVSSGTSTSTRWRGEPNSLNVLRIDRPRLGIERHSWQPETNLFQPDLAGEFCPHRRRLDARVNAKTPLHFLRRRLSPEGAFGLHLTIGMVVMILGYWSFAEIAEGVRPGSPLVARDEAVTQWFHARATPGLTSAARVVTTFGSVGFLTAGSLACAAFLYQRKAWNRLLALGATMLGGSLLNIVLKHFFHRQRPVLENPLVTLNSYGFPSGHTMGATVFYGLLALFAIYAHRTWARGVLAAFVAGVIVIAIGLTRIYLGAHYLTDVLAAFAAGAVWLAFCWTGLESLRKRRPVRGYSSPS